MSQIIDLILCILKINTLGNWNTEANIIVQIFLMLYPAFAVLVIH